jgi:hypothetical protein
LSNDGDDIHLEAASWIKGELGMQANKPSKIGYLIKKYPGGQFESESTDKFVPSGMWVKMWIGLDSSMPDSADLTKLTADRRLGIVEIPARIFGTPVKIRIPL